MDITSVATSTSSVEPNKHEKNGTGDDESGDPAQQQHSVQPCQLQQLYRLCTMVWYRTDLGQLT